MSEKRPWIQVIEPEEASGRLKEIYDETAKKRGKLADIHKIHSLNPESLTAHMGLYMTLMFGKSPLSRRERELIGVAVSRANGCAYCVAHHSDALARYEKRDGYVNLISNGLSGSVDAKDACLIRFSEKITRSPKDMAEADLKGLRDQGFDDVVQIAGYFNFVNRLVLGLGLSPENEAERQGFKY